MLQREAIVYETGLSMGQLTMPVYFPLPLCQEGGSFLYHSLTVVNQIELCYASLCLLLY